jgi:cAMP-specific phosphodiesterase 4/calcium/calmodulin-dependent 3',5'-cyclic nucleotide phosphodiesterase
MLSYPEMDDSMGAWVQLLSTNVQDYSTALSVVPQVANVTQYYQARLDRELKRFSNFYDQYNYGPFSVCTGTRVEEFGVFTCNHTFTSTYIPFTTNFEQPERLSMVREMSTASFMIGYDMSTPKQLESVANISLICFIVVVMVVFGLLTSSSISTIALKPLERMLAVVRERCSEIFKYTTTLDEQDEDSNAGDEEYEDMEKVESSSEFALLERVVAKLTAIASLSMQKCEPEVRDGMGEDEIMTLNYLGTQVQSSTRRGDGGRITVAASPHNLPNGSKQSADMFNQVSEGDRSESASDEREDKEINLEVVEMLETQSFDCFCDAETLGERHDAITLYIIQNYDGCDSWLRTNVQESRLMKFVEKVESGYQPNPWHNYYHALDVLYGAVRYMTLIEASLFLSEEKQFWLMIACVGHDLGHIGVNNTFLVETCHELALRYNDKSPLENMHCARLFQVTGDEEANIFSQLEKEVYKEMRKGMIAAILHTDVVEHGKMVKELCLLYQMNSECFDALEPNPRFIEVLSGQTQLLLNMLLHGADMSNPTRPWNLCEKYSYLIMDEFFAQGDTEKELGIPVQMLNDREKVVVPNSQIGFIEFMIFPMVESMVNLFCTLDGMAENLGSNIANWNDMWIKEASPPEEAAAKVKGRVDKVVRRCKALDREVRAAALTS